MGGDTEIPMETPILGGLRYQWGPQNWGGGTKMPMGTPKFGGGIEMPMGTPELGGGLSPPIHYYRNLFGLVGDPKIGGGAVRCQ